ncbi:MAG TPA: arginine N-succinyltransferase [Novosphingobium sp.]|nr:arginine N-succinyltransferase [Novosphingobium sp.]
MPLVVRAVRTGDVPALYRMAQQTGAGFTNLPADLPALEAKVARALACFARPEEAPADDLYLFVLEDPATGALCGTCQIFARIGSQWPFYSYRLGALTQFSKELGRAFRAETLNLCTDLDGASEVGGLFLEAGARAAGAGRLLARSRYLFMRRHRARFASRTIAELRGALDEAGRSPFWEGLAGRFFGMPFDEADGFNALHGNQFIADLMPKHPIYTSMLPEAARASIGQPHRNGEAAMRLLQQEGFRFDCYVDIFDGGPTMVVDTDRIATLRGARLARVAALADAGRPEGAPGALVATGALGDFRCCIGAVAGEGEAVVLNAAAARALGVGPGDAILYTGLLKAE